MILNLNHVSLITNNLEQSLYFYQDVLGLKKIPRPELGFDGAWLSLGRDVSLHLLSLPNPDPTINRPNHAGRDRHIALQVNNLEVAKQQLVIHNISFTLSRSGRTSIFLRDPDGNGIELMA